jgi:hypothetical protein
MIGNRIWAIALGAASATVCSTPLSDVGFAVNRAFCKSQCVLE